MSAEWRRMGYRLGAGVCFGRRACQWYWFSWRLNVKEDTTNSKAVSRRDRRDLPDLRESASGGGSGPALLLDADLLQVLLRLRRAQEAELVVQFLADREIAFAIGEQYQLVLGASVEKALDDRTFVFDAELRVEEPQLLVAAGLAERQDRARAKIAIHLGLRNLHQRRAVGALAERFHDLALYRDIRRRIYGQQDLRDVGAAEPSELAHGGHAHRHGTGLCDLHDRIARVTTVRLRQHEHRTARGSGIPNLEGNPFEDRNRLVWIGPHQETERLDPHIGVRLVILGQPDRHRLDCHDSRRVRRRGRRRRGA